MDEGCVCNGGVEEAFLCKAFACDIIPNCNVICYVVGGLVDWEEKRYMHLADDVKEGIRGIFVLVAGIIENPAPPYLRPCIIAAGWIEVVVKVTGGICLVEISRI